MATCRFVIRGRVQGVGFRHAMRREAERLGLHGWVRNRFDGTVEAVAAGDADRIDALQRWAQRGPPSAHVDTVDVTPVSAETTAQLQPPIGADFRQVETAWD